MSILYQSEDICVSNQGTSILHGPTTSLHGGWFHITMSIQSSIGNGHANTRPIRVGFPTYLKEQVLYGANYSEDAIIFEPRPGLDATSIHSDFGQSNINPAPSWQLTTNPRQSTANLYGRRRKSWGNQYYRDDYPTLSHISSIRQSNANPTPIYKQSVRTMYKYLMELVLQGAD